MPDRIGIPLEDWKERAKKPASTVIVHNTHPVQAHIIFDKAGYSVELKAGERREVVMLDEDILNLLEQRRPGRIKTNAEGDLFTCPLHPLVIEDVPVLAPANAPAAEEARQPIK